MTTVVKTWQHGDKPTAAELNKYCDALDEAHATLGDLPFQLAVEKQSESVFWLFHGYRYLHFGSTGALVDPNGIYPDVSLSESDTGVGVLDLDTVTWLTYGGVYKVTGVSWCQEDWDA